MSKNKNIYEGIIDRIVTRIIHKVADGVSGQALDRVKKVDPKLAQSMAKVIKAKKEMESHLSKSDLSKVRRGELPDWMKQYDKG